jgi:hypothetical protein
VEPYALPLPPGVEPEDSPSGLFVAPAGAPSESDPPLRRIVLRVVQGEDDEELILPFVLFSVQLTASPLSQAGGPRRGPGDRPEGGGPGEGDSRVRSLSRPGISFEGRR